MLLLCISKLIPFWSNNIYSWWFELYKFIDTHFIAWKMIYLDSIPFTLEKIVYSHKVGLECSENVN